MIDYFKSCDHSKFNVKIACPCIDRSDQPVTDFSRLTKSFIARVQTSPLLTFGLSIDAAYELIFKECMERGMTHVFIVESDVIVPVSALDRLLMRNIVEGHPFVGGVYPYKNDTDICPAVTDYPPLQTRVPTPYVRRGLVPITHALPMGCCLIDLRVLNSLPKPWLKTTSFINAHGVQEDITQDAWLTVRFNQSGYTPMLDTNIQCVHVCRKTQKCYGSPELVERGQIRAEASGSLAIHSNTTTAGPEVLKGD